MSNEDPENYPEDQLRHLYRTLMMHDIRMFCYEQEAIVPDTLMFTWGEHKSILFMN